MKQRIFNGKKFLLANYLYRFNGKPSERLSKDEAENTAKAYQKRGFLIRNIKEKHGYSVYFAYPGKRKFCMHEINNPSH